MVLVWCLGLWAVGVGAVCECVWGGGGKSSTLLQRLFLWTDPLADLMTQLHVQHINVYILDVEGAELLILQSVDFSKV